jgi:hypothetical protein
LEWRQFGGELFADMGAEAHTHINDHHQGNAEIRLDGNDRQAHGPASDIQRVFLAGEEF